VSLLSFSIGELGACGRVGDPSKDGTTAPPSASIAASSDSSANDAGSLVRDGLSSGSSSADTTQSTASEAGAPAVSGAFTCPAPDPNGGAGSGQPVWARDLASGNCCNYDSAFLAPQTWPVFDSQSECESSCRCADVEPANPDDPSLPPDFQAELRKVTRESISLECFCGAGFTCYHTLAEAHSTLCGQDAAPAFGATQRSGCGLVELVISGGFFAESWVFDAATGALVGSELGGDGAAPPCRSVTMRGGRSFSCSDTITECQLCGDTNPIISSQPLEACP
jgi:hypothetical protein